MEESKAVLLVEMYPIWMTDDLKISIKKPDPSCLMKEAMTLFVRALYAAGYEIRKAR